MSVHELILVRHGQTLHNVAGIAQGWNDSALSELGQMQVRCLAERVARRHPRVLYSSPLPRALSTAEAIAAATGLEIRPLDDLREMSYGSWEGLSFLDVRRDDAAIYERWIADESCPSPGGESHRDVRDRVARALQEIGAGPSPAVVVSHSTAIRVAATAFLELPVMMSRHFAQDNAAMNVLIRRGDHPIMKLWNDTSHCDQQ